MFSWPSAALVRVTVGAGELRIDPDDVEVERMGVARVAGERPIPGSSSTAASYIAT